MRIPLGSYMVVTRHSKDHSGRGEVRDKGLTQSMAEARKGFYQAPDVFVWVIHENDY